MKLSREEKELGNSIEHGEWEIVPDAENEMERYREYAGSMFRKDKDQRN